MTNDIEHAVRRHYGVTDLGLRLQRALTAAGVADRQITIDDLAPVDEFHIGGRVATEHILGKLDLAGTEYVLDVGCGIGGAARFIAARTGCRVEGIDLTPEFIEVARDLTERTGLAGQASFTVGSALAMPYPDATFDAAVTLHVAMNIADRAALYREVARVLKPHAPFAIYDVMRGPSPDGLCYPVPWADTPETSFLVTPEDMRALLADAGFAADEVEDRTAFGIQFFRERLAGGPSPLGLQLLMGETARDRLENTLAGLESGSIAPVLIRARRLAG